LRTLRPRVLRRLVEHKATVTSARVGDPQPSDPMLVRSSQKSEPDWHSISEYAAVWQVCLTLRLMTAAESPVRDWRDRAE
jgi:hypothetical protein